MLYALRLPYLSNTEVVLFVRLSTATDKLLGPKIVNSIKYVSQGHSDALPHRASNQDLATISITSLALYQMSHAAASDLLCTNTFM